MSDKLIIITMILKLYTISTILLKYLRDSKTSCYKIQWQHFFRFLSSKCFVHKYE